MSIAAGNDILAAELQRIAPIGVILPYAGPTGTVIAGWLECTGTAVSRTTYAELFAVIGTTYGAGNGSTTFNLPDLRGRIPLGVGLGAGDGRTGTATGTPTGTALANRILGEWGGEQAHPLTVGELAPHTHSISLTGDAASTDTVGSTGNNARGSANTGSAGSGTAHNNLQPFLVLNFIIRASYS